MMLATLVSTSLDNIEIMHFLLHLSPQLIEIYSSCLEWLRSPLINNVLDVLHGVKNNEPGFNIKDVAKAMSNIQ